MNRSHLLTKNRISILIALVAALVYLPWLGAVDLFDWDEVNFAEAAREMVLTDEWSYVQINFQPFWEKPPLFIWMQALSMKALGINAFAARFPNAIAGIVTLVMLFRIGSTLVNTRFGVLWTLAYAGAMLPGFYFRSGIIDPCFNLFIFSGIHQLAVGSSIFPMSRWRIFGAGLLFGLAVLTKGPVGVGVPALVIMFFGLWHWRDVRVRYTDPLLFLAPVLLVGFSWFILEVMRGHGQVVLDFLAYNIRLATTSEAGHGQPFYYHTVVLLLGCFPISIFFLLSLRKQAEAPEHNRYYRWMQLLFWVVLIAFSLVKTKIIHYSSLTYFPMSFLAAYHIKRLLDGKWKFGKVHFAAFGLQVVLLGIVFTLAGMFNTIRPKLLTLLANDAFATELFANAVQERIWEPLIGLCFILTTLTALWWIYAQLIWQGIALLFATSGIVVWLLGIIIAPKILYYTQSDLMAFYTEKRTEDCYLRPMHFHTYAHLYYGEAQPKCNPKSLDLAWLVNGQVDKPVYFIARITDIDQVHRWFPHVQVTEHRGPYVIMQRTDASYPFQRYFLPAEN